MTRKYPLYVLFVFTAGCSGQDNSMNEELGQDSVFESRTGTIDQAEALEQQIDDAAAERKQAIEEQGG